jgi:outer membrane protein TolC
MQRQTTTQAHILYNPGFTSFLSLAVYHPLLNGAGRDYTQRFRNLAENDRRIAYEAFHTDLTNTLSAAANAYWDFGALREKEKLAEQALALAQRTYEGTKQRIELGTVAGNELITAQSQVAARRRDLVVAQTNTQLQEIRIKGLITKMVGADIARIRFEPEDTLSDLVDTPLPPLADALMSAMRRSSIRQAELGLENQRIAETFTSSNLRPTLSAFTQINSYTLAPGMSEMFKQMIDYAYPEFAVGFTLSFPVKNRAAQADDVRARLELQQASVAFEQTKANLGIQVRTALTNSTQTRAQIDAAHRAVQASQRTADGEQDRWAAGVSTLSNVLQAQLDLATAQAAEIQARVDHAKAVIAQEVAIGTFLENHGINFDDALKGRLWKGSLK